MDVLKYMFGFVLMVLILSACVKSGFEIDNYQSEIVVDGWIEQGQYCQVFLTLSVPYFSDVDSLSIRDYALTKARVTLSNGVQSEILTLKPNDSYFPPYYYTSTEIKGEAGKIYNLTVEYQGKTAFATTSIPEPVALDSTWFALAEGKDSLGFIWLKFTDNLLVNNYYRTLTQIQGVDVKYIANYLPNFNDTYFNGQKIEVSLYKGNKTTTDKSDEIYYTLGDTILLKFCTVDKASYDFWYSFQKEVINAGNPFASTNARVKSNVSNGLGVWCGYGASYYRIIAQ
jgi:hypothetical protein